MRLISSKEPGAQKMFHKLFFFQWWNEPFYVCIFLRENVLVIIIINPTNNTSPLSPATYSFFYISNFSYWHHLHHFRQQSTMFQRVPPSRLL